MSRQYFEAESHVSTYNKFRPKPPESMVQEIVRFTSEKLSGPLDVAVDVGCGSGQSTEVFAPYFKRVVGLDPSSSIVREAIAKCKHSNVSYSQGSAETIPLDNGAVNLVSACQSIHWFNIPKFYEEANRILCKNGVLASYGYRLPVPVVDGAKDDLQSIVQKYYIDVLGDYTMLQSRKAYLEHYTASEFNEVSFISGGKMQRFENFYTQVDGNIDDLVGYISSWSTYQNYAKQMGVEKAEKILEGFKADFTSLLGRAINPLTKFKIRYNYFLLLGRKA